MNRDRSGILSTSEDQGPHSDFSPLQCSVPVLFPVGGGAMIRDLSIYSATLALLLATQICDAQEATSAAPLRVAVAGLVHGHVAGFLNQSLHRPDIQLVGIAETDQQ